MENIKRFKSGDHILLWLGFIIIVALLGFYLKGEAVPGDVNASRRAVITRNGNKMAELDLNKVEEPQYFTFDDGIHVTILAEKGSIKFLEADCPDKICIKTGTLTKPGSQAICMPSRTIVKILDD